MSSHHSTPRANPAPELPAGEWLNSTRLTLASLRGNAVILYFWDYSLLASLPLLAEIRRLSQRYAALPVRFVGVHTPAFAFGRETAIVREALQQHAITHPTLLDTDYRAAQSYFIPAPACAFVIDSDGNLRAAAAEMFTALESVLQDALRDTDGTISLPSLGETDALPDIIDLPTGGLPRDYLGNPEGYAFKAPILYQLPEQRPEGRFYAGSAWRGSSEYFAYEGRSEGMLVLPYRARAVYAVLSSHHDMIERIVHPQTVAVEIWQDDRALDDAQRGDDVTADGRVLVDRPRLYHLVRNDDDAPHELTLRVRATGFSIYAFGLWDAS